MLNKKKKSLENLNCDDYGRTPTQTSLPKQCELLIIKLSYLLCRNLIYNANSQKMSQPA